MSANLMQYLPKGAYALADFDFPEGSSRQDIVRFCQQRHGILVTVDSEYVLLLVTDTQAAWGVILLPQAETSQIDVLRRLLAGSLHFRPPTERTSVTEYIRRNRLLLDIRRDPPILSLYFNCCWQPESQ